MDTYLNLLKDVLENGTPRGDRTGTGTLSVFGRQVRFDLRHGFPCLTTKKLHLKSIIHELLWFLQGSTNTAYLKENQVTIWDEWADAEGNLGPVYGKQWRDWNGVDQISELIHGLKTNPESRRHIVSAWNVGQIPEMALPPCHALFQFYVTPAQAANEKPLLSCQLYQRSADLFLGVPFNIASYALLLMMVAQVTGMEAGEFIHTFGDLHLYQNHLDQARTQLARQPRALPRMEINPAISRLEDFQFSDFSLVNYDPHPRISAPISV